jgi:large subunit ribosomal protein L22
MAKETVKAIKTVKAVKVAKADKKVTPVATVVKREYKVFVKNVAQSPLKLRLVANMVRGKKVELAINELTFLNKKGSLFVLKAIKSGMANAKSLHDVAAANLYIKTIAINEATGLKRGRVASRSHVASILKRRAHINLVLAEK